MVWCTEIIRAYVEEFEKIRTFKLLLAYLTPIVNERQTIRHA
ncbi:unnamed protein product [Moneuplotes crassus]|uniref:Uncharacterized protein n=1 Tax=Euplotes crassus TaxID=5936 RepID=A0AAD1XI16_EUPCR|nr:unnamed protein product [Moneuplotes crassus]